MSEGAGLKDVPFLCKAMIDVSTEKQRRKQKKRQKRLSFPALTCAHGQALSPQAPGYRRSKVGWPTAGRAENQTHELGNQ